MQVEFLYNGKSIIIQCNRYDTIEQIFQKFSVKSGADINSVSFIYNGNANYNRNLIIDQVANFEDKKRNKMTILVYGINKSLMHPNYINTKNINNPILVTQYSNPIQNQKLYNNNCKT